MIRLVGLGILTVALWGCGPTQSTQNTALRQAQLVGVDIPEGMEITLPQAHAVILALDADIDNQSRQNRIRGILGL